MGRESSCWDLTCRLREVFGEVWGEVQASPQRGRLALRPKTEGLLPRSPSATAPPKSLTVGVRRRGASRQPIKNN